MEITGYIKLERGREGGRQGLKEGGRKGKKEEEKVKKDGKKRREEDTRKEGRVERRGGERKKKQSTLMLSSSSQQRKGVITLKSPLPRIIFPVWRTIGWVHVKMLKSKNISNFKVFLEQKNIHM